MKVKRIDELQAILTQMIQWTDPHGDDEISHSEADKLLRKTIELLAKHCTPEERVIIAQILEQDTHVTKYCS